MDGAGSKPWVPQAVIHGLVFKPPNNLLHCVPHFCSTFVHVPVGISNNFYVSVKLKTVQYLPASLSHKIASKFNGVVDFIQGRFDQHRVMNRSTHTDTGFGQMDTSQSQHLRTVSLHGEIANTAGVKINYRL